MAIAVGRPTCQLPARPRALLHRASAVAARLSNTVVMVHPCLQEASSGSLTALATTWRRLTRCAVCAGHHCLACSGSLPGGCGRSSAACGCACQLVCTRLPGAPASRLAPPEQLALARIRVVQALSQVQSPSDMGTFLHRAPAMVRADLKPGGSWPARRVGVGLQRAAAGHKKGGSWPARRVGAACKHGLLAMLGQLGTHPAHQYRTNYLPTPHSAACMALAC